MLTLKSMSWDNCFSYGDDNCLRFDENPLTQLVGPNGAGKTSISLMIQEALYGKNNKNIKKQDIANNKSGKKGYRISLDFDKDGDVYTVELVRTSNLKFRLYKNGEDISSHTSLNTYKTLAEIIGIDDFKVFCQLIYQHSTDSLDFLTATDTNRKKFLINLLQLDRYLELHEHFKERVRVINLEITSLQGSIDTIERWIDRHKDFDFIKHEFEKIPEVPEELVARKEELRRQLDNIDKINRKIHTNNEYLKQLQALNPEYYLGAAPQMPSPSSQELRAQMHVLNGEIKIHEAKVAKITKAEGTCPECLQEVDENVAEKMLTEEVYERDSRRANVGILKDSISKAESIEAEVAKYQREKREFERLSQLIDDTLSSKTLDRGELSTEYNNIVQEMNTVYHLKKKAEEKNKEVAAHNSKVDVVKAQLEEFKVDAHEKNIQLVEKENMLYVLDLLKKTFSTNGLVSYKIESSVKELEVKINEYLSDLTHFQIYFKLAGEKLNIEVVDDIGNVTSISNLSSGERARVNIATILAIRSILSSLTSTKINLLFLDEVIGVIDAEGKEKLAEILLKENLNTFIVSHDWNHPLIPKVNIIKEHHMSRIEYD